MGRQRYDVVYKHALWCLTHNGETLSYNLTKPPAIDAGVKVARANAPSQLLIHRENGTIEDERTYGDDPSPPRG